MKKLLTLLALATLLFSGCSKSDMQQSSTGEGPEFLETVTFTADIPDQSAVQTRAFTPKDDGKGESANRCIMEVYYNNKVYKREIKALDSNKKANFTVKLPANRTYDVLFWADHVAATSTDEELATDKYYVTNSEDGLKNVSFKGTYAGNDDARDAFSFYKECTIAQGGETYNFSLTRPFSQINVITTDVQQFKTAVDAIPDQVDVTLKNPYTSFNVKTGELGGQVSELHYTADLYEFPKENEFEGVSQAKLSMDYVLAPAAQEAIDIDWKALHGSDSPIVHAFTNIPYRRNYRTNIKGDLLTSNASWTVTVDAQWSSPDYLYEVVNDIQDANDVIKKNLLNNNNNIFIKFKGQPGDAGKPGTIGNETKAGEVTNKAIVTSVLPEDASLTIMIEAETRDLYIGDYVEETSTVIATTGLNHGSVKVNVPGTGSIQKLVVNAPSKTVTINGDKVDPAGVIKDVDAIVSDNSLIVNKGQAINGLTFKQGGLEIHGTVGSVEVKVEEGKNVYVRDCENLDETNVYNKLKDYIADGYVGVKGLTASDKWDIVPYADCEASIGKIGYQTLAEAMAAVKEGETVIVRKDISLSNTLSLNVNANYSLDLNGFDITSSTDAFQVLAGKLTVIGNGTIDTQGTDSKYSFRVANNGKLVIGAQNQNYDIKINDLVKSMTETTIWGGTISKVCCYASYDGTKSDVYVNGGAIKDFDNWGLWSEDCPTTIYINGGIFGVKPGEELVPEYARGYCKFVIKEGYTIVANKDEQTKGDYPWTISWENQAKIGTTEYPTVPDAFAAVESGQTIELLKNCQISSTITVDKDVILDLKEKTLTVNMANWGFNVNNGKKFTLKNGNVSDGTNGMVWGVVNSLSNTSQNRTGVTVDGVQFGTFNTDQGSIVRLRGNVDATVKESSATTDERFVCADGNSNTVTAKNCNITDTYGFGTATFIINGYKDIDIDGVTINGTGTDQSESARQSLIEFYPGDDADTVVIKNCNLTNSGPGNVIYAGGNAKIINCTVVSTSTCTVENRMSAVATASERRVKIYGGTYKSAKGHAIKIFNSGGFFDIYDKYQETSAPVIIEGLYSLYGDTKNAGEPEDHDGAINLFGNNISTKGMWGTQHSARIFVDGGYHDVTVGDSNPDNLILSGGTYTMDPRTNNCFKIPDGYKVVADGGDPATWTVKATTPGNAGTTGFGDWK